MLNVQTSQYHLYAYSESILSLVIFNPVLANKVNKKFNYYKDVRITKGEEPVFKLTYNQFAQIHKMAAFKHVSLK